MCVPDERSNNDTIQIVTFGRGKPKMGLLRRRLLVSSARVDL